MQTTLEKAITKLQTLPPEKQEFMAAVILEELEKVEKMSKEPIAVLEAKELEGYKRQPPQKDDIESWQDEQVWES
jgi:hypothetical protein